MKIGFIVVIYNENYEVSTAFQSLEKSLNDTDWDDYAIYIYDNSDLEEFANYQPPVNGKVVYHKDSTNPGIGVAYNFMARKAAEDGMEWIVMFDQDTTLANNLVSAYLKSITINPDVLIKVPILHVDDYIFSPFKYFLMRGIKLKSITKNILSLNNYAFVNSGMMVNLKLFQSSGGYNEKIKLDFADLQFVERVKKQTTQFEVLEVHCQQSFSSNEIDINKVLNRYKIYIKDLKNFEAATIIDTICLYRISLFRMLRLTWQFKSLEFIKLNLKSAFKRSR